MLYMPSPSCSAAPSPPCRAEHRQLLDTAVPPPTASSEPSPPPPPPRQRRPSHQGPPAARRRAAARRPGRHRRYNCLKEFFTAKAGSMPGTEEPEWSSSAARTSRPPRPRPTPPRQRPSLRSRPSDSGLSRRRRPAQMRDAEPRTWLYPRLQAGRARRRRTSLPREGLVLLLCLALGAYPTNMRKLLCCGYIRSVIGGASCPL